MAIYLTHKYGQRFYGPEPDLPRFDAERFVAYSSDYDTVRIIWEPPVGDFEGFRLVKSAYGLPASESDGQVLLDQVVPDVGFDDTHVEPGAFAYYGIFLKIGGVWTPTGYASCLHIANLNSTTWLWTHLPNHYRLLRGNHLTLQADNNTDLLRYMTVLGWGLDHIRTSMRAAWQAHDIDTTHADVVDLIIAQHGLPAYPGLTGLRRRAIARDGVALATSKGTLDALAAIVRTTSGWDVEIRNGRNLVGSYDRSGMINPLPPEWDPSVRYPVGARVHFFGVSYKCLVAAYSYDQMPDGEGATNTWWARLSVVEATTVAYHAGSASQHGWQGMSHTAGQPDSKVQTKLVLGIPKPGEVTQDTNAVTVHNTHSATLNAGARLLPVDQALPVPDPLRVVTHAIPMPLPQEWDPTIAYRAGTVVSYRGRIWHATRPAGTGNAPIADSDRWTAINTDNRVRVCASAYTHQPHTDATKPAVACQMYIEWYDDRGKLITREFGAASDTRILDTFTAYNGSAIAALGGRSVEYGVLAWTDQVPGFVRDSYSYGVVRPSLAAGRSLSTIDYGSANASVAATMATAPAAGKVQALILRFVSATSYLRATRTALQSVSGATVTTLATYGTPIADGDRLTVTVTGNNYTIKRNATVTGTATSAFNAASTIFGIAVEAA